jgi:hypothetical protein
LTGIAAMTPFHQDLISCWHGMSSLTHLERELT